VPQAISWRSTRARTNARASSTLPSVVKATMKGVSLPANCVAEG
jgi:hypothetical protein